MTIYYQAAKNNIVMHFKASDRWYMIADCDTKGRACLFLNINGVVAPILDSSDSQYSHPHIGNSKVLELYNAMVKEIFERFKCGEEYLDLAEIEEKLLPKLMEKWKRN